MGLKKRNTSHDPKRGPFIKKVKEYNNSLNIVDKALELSPSVYLKIEDNTLLVLKGSKGSPIKGDTTLETRVKKPNPLKLLISIYFFK